MSLGAVGFILTKFALGMRAQACADHKMLQIIDGYKFVFLPVWQSTNDTGG